MEIPFLLHTSTFGFVSGRGSVLPRNRGLRVPLVMAFVLWWLLWAGSGFTRRGCVCHGGVAFAGFLAAFFLKSCSQRGGRRHRQFLSGVLSRLDASFSKGVLVRTDLRKIPRTGWWFLGLTLSKGSQAVIVPSEHSSPDPKHSFGTQVQRHELSQALKPIAFTKHVCAFAYWRRNPVSLKVFSNRGVLFTLTHYLSQNGFLMLSRFRGNTDPLRVFGERRCNPRERKRAQAPGGQEIRKSIIKTKEFEKGRGGHLSISCKSCFRENSHYVSKSTAVFYDSYLHSGSVKDLQSFWAKGLRNPTCLAVPVTTRLAP
jgi:hypothetical protein